LYLRTREVGTIFHVSPLGVHGKICIALIPVDNEEVTLLTKDGLPRVMLPGITRFADVVTKLLESPLIVPKSLNV
jgi:hypothetical protein